MRTLWVLAASLVVVGCASQPAAPVPAWYTARAQTAPHTYPTFRDVPRTTDVNADPAHWAEVHADVVGAGEALRNDPRAQWTPPDDPNAFIADARAVLEQTRAAHGPD